MPKPDILVFMSDQHSPIFSSFIAGIAKTPNMEKMCENGTMFTEAYTSCPLCVPARMSMLLGRLPSNTGIFTNQGAISDSDPTFLHSLVADGYETVLIGRMHFVGKDQRHGFTKRLVGDITPVTWTRPEDKLAMERGVFKKCFGDPGCISVIGGGDSPVLEFDKEVIEAALLYMSEPHKKPQCIVVGTYGPHFPYIAPPDVYAYYKERVSVPDTFKNPPDSLPPFLMKRMQEVSKETVLKARASYFGMIETIDSQLGQVRDAFNSFLIKNGRQGVLAYISDHGDQVGDRKIFGKQTFFETSAKIPMIFEGQGIKKMQKITSPVSIMDIGPTLCEIAGTSPPSRQDGKSLVPSLFEGKNEDRRVVISELMLNFKDEPVLGRMVRKGKYKFITFCGYEDYDMLFDIENDPDEIYNLANTCPKELEELREIAYDNWEPGRVIEENKNYLSNIELIKAYEKETGPDDSERWNRNPEYARVMPQIQ